MKQTAVQWLYNHLFPKQLDGFSDEEWSKIDLAFEKAKQMEKQQIIEAYNEGQNTPYEYSESNDVNWYDGNNYYKETYNS